MLKMTARWIVVIVAVFVHLVVVPLVPGSES